MFRNLSIYPSQEDSLFLKAIFTVLVLVHHVYQEIPFLSGSFIEVIFLSLGYLSVALFFFLSGYGLAYSEKKKGQIYINNMPSKRIVPFYFQIDLLNVIYFFVNGFLNDKFEFSRLMKSFFQNDVIVRNGWYLMVALMLYVVFYYVYKIISNTYLRIVSITIFLFCFMIACIKVFEYGEWWYQSNMAFVAGLIMGTVNNDKNEYNLKSYVLLICCFVVFFYTFRMINFKSLNFNLYYLVKSMCCVSFSLLSILLSKMFKIRSRVISYISKISFEIYVSQGIFLSIFHSNKIYINNSLMYFLLVVSTTFLFSVLLNIVFEKLNEKLVL